MLNMNNQKGIFKIILNAVLTLTLISLCVSVVLSFIEPLTPHQQSLFESCSTTWKMGFGAIVGLLGGKAIDGG